VAVTLVTRDDLFRLQKIERLIGNEVYKAPLPEFLAGIKDERTEAKGQKASFRGKKFHRRNPGQNRKSGQSRSQGQSGKPDQKPASQ
jgi:hypothetical protein